MISPIIPGTSLPPFTPAERKALRSLRASYQSAQHLFTDRELAHLRFLRWHLRRFARDGAIDEVDSQETTGTAAHETRGCAEEMPAWIPGFIA